MSKKALNKYQRIIEKVFLDRYMSGVEKVDFSRTDLEDVIKSLGMTAPKNLGDILYYFRYRNSLPDSIIKTQTENKEWVIIGAGQAQYSFKLVTVNRIIPNPNLAAIKIPDATPEIIIAHALSDEQALLAKVRYNRVIDIFLGVAAYSLQNHLRTTVKGIGQIEIDELYAAIDKQGRQFIIPVQAKGGSDKLSIVQTQQDMECCSQKYPELICRAISTQFISDDLIAVFELVVDEGSVKISEEKHYKLVPSSHISKEDLAVYNVKV